LKGIRFMKKITLSLLLLALLATVFFIHRQYSQRPVVTAVVQQAEHVEPLEKPKIIVFTSKGGAGHSSATQAIKDTLGKQFNVISINVLTEILGSLDPLVKLSRGKMSGEDLVNISAKNNWLWIINKLRSIGIKLNARMLPQMKALIAQYLKKERPAMVISVMPLINAATLGATQELDIPFLVVGTDIDTSLYVEGMHDVEKAQKFIYGMAFDEPLALQKVSHVIPKDKIRIVGFPLRSGFFEEKSEQKKADIRKEFNIPDNKFVIMMIMGGAGSKKAYQFLRMLLRSSHDFHIIVCCGRNEKLLKKVEQLQTRSPKSMTVLGFTQQIADLMAVSDLFITKPGPNSIVEALYMDLPMLIDATDTILNWEKMNIDFVQQYGFGYIINKYKQVLPMLDALLTNKTSYATIKDAMQRFAKKNFPCNLKDVVQELLPAMKIDKSGCIIKI